MLDEPANDLSVRFLGIHFAHQELFCELAPNF